MGTKRRDDCETEVKCRAQAAAIDFRQYAKSPLNVTQRT
jgi:hypothetical protein